MTDKQLGRMLVETDVAESGRSYDAHELTLKIFKRDKLWSRILTALTLSAWLLTVSGVGVVGYAYFWLYHTEPLLLGQNSVDDRQRVLTAVDLRSEVGRHCLILLTISISVLAVANLSTLLLVFNTRRATLRQVNVSLREISEQLKALRQTADT